ncbi:hypothetical protein B0H19DRAFT_919873 [Mycena capillaripes]|nr:hypothetical protein B0H19DRAFT_919873 [Mycena capillaripes]
MSSPPAKRPRTEDAITRSDIWYNDGSVILQAENTQFRVHWSVLALHSSFFREMQGLPQPADQPSIDGCPIVELQDAIVDVEHLLKVLYHPTLLLQKALPFPVVAALIRLGRKYDFHDLFDTAVERLKFENPTTLKEYDALLVPGTSHYKPTRILHYPGVLFDMLTVARENNIRSVLPCAYYRACSDFSQKCFFDGLRRGDATSASLAPLDQRRCVVGSESLIKVQGHPGYTFGWLCSWDDENCTDFLKCARVHTKALRQYHASLSVWALTPSTPGHGHGQLCASCQQQRQELFVAGREKVWEELPGFFELPPWSELTNDNP